MLKSGILNLTLSAVVSAEEYEGSFEILKAVIKDLAEGECALDDVEPDDPTYSVYGGVDRSLFEEDSGVAMMESAVKRTTAERDSSFSAKGANATSTEKMLAVFKWLMIGAGAAAPVSFGLMLGANWFSVTMAELARNVTTQLMKDSGAVLTAMVGGSHFEWVAGQTGYSTLSVIGRCAAAVFGVVFAVAVVTAIVVALVFSMVGIWAPASDADYIGIPRVVCAAQTLCTYTVNLNGKITVDHNAEGYAYYYGVRNPYLKDGEKDPSGNDLSVNRVADVANWSQNGMRQWIALYTSKDMSVGQPILASSLQIDERPWVYGKRAVTMFDTGDTCDMQKYLENNTAQKFLHYARDESYNPYADAVAGANGAASVFAEPSTYVIGAIGLVLGLGAGCGITLSAYKKKENE